VASVRHGVTRKRRPQARWSRQIRATRAQPRHVLPDPEQPRHRVPRRRGTNRTASRTVSPQWSRPVRST
jgi:hypothetical protein